MYMIGIKGSSGPASASLSCRSNFSAELLHEGATITVSSIPRRETLSLLMRSVYMASPPSSRTLV